MDNDKLNILFLRSVLDTYGASKMMFQLADGLMDKGYNIVFGSDNQDNFKSHLRARGIQHYTLPLNDDKKNLTNFFVSFFKIVSIIKKEKINLIHSHHRWSSFISFFVSRLFRIPLVTTYHGISQGNRSSTLWGDMIISVSEDAKNQLIKYFKVNPTKIRVIQNGIKIDEICRVNDIEDRDTSSLLNKSLEPTIACIARLAPEKDHRTLFHAIKKVVVGFPLLKVMIVGSGPLENELKDLALNLGISNHINFIGETDNINLILEKIEFLVLSSYTEGLPISVLESLAFAKPVVATDVGDISEVVINDKTGLLVPPNNPEKLAEAIKSMLLDKKKAEVMGKNGKMLIKERFTIDKMVVKTEDLYFELLAP